MYPSRYRIFVNTLLTLRLLRASPTATGIFRRDLYDLFATHPSEIIRPANVVNHPQYWTDGRPNPFVTPADDSDGAGDGETGPYVSLTAAEFGPKARESSSIRK